MKGTISDNSSFEKDRENQKQTVSVRSQSGREKKKRNRS